MSSTISFRKISRVAGSALVLGGTAALLLIGAPADAETVRSLGRGVSIATGRGV